MSAYNSISVETLAKLQSQDEVDLIDVRTPAEFRVVHAVMARNVPLDSLSAREVMADRNGTSNTPLYVICKSGGRSSQACQKLVDEGLSSVVNVEGGTTAWERAGLPVERGRKTISLERQVRICAGLITFLGSLATMITGNVYLDGIPAFIGAGLTFAGVTDTCGMGMVLARMPWNR